MKKSDIAKILIGLLLSLLFILLLNHLTSIINQKDYHIAELENEIGSKDKYIEFLQKDSSTSVLLFPKNIFQGNIIYFDTVFNEAISNEFIEIPLGKSTGKFTLYYKNGQEFNFYVNQEDDYPQGFHSQ